MAPAPLEVDHRSAFAQPRFRRYFPSSCLSTLGGWVIRFLFGWVAWELTASAFWVGSVAGLMLVPTFILSPLFGITADRIDPRNGLLVTIAFQALLSGLTGAIAFYGALTLPMLMVLAFAFGAVTAAHTPIRLALIPRLVERGALPSAIGYSAIIFNSSRILGPALGAALISRASVPWAFAVAALVCTLALLLLLRVTGTAPRSDSRREGSFVAQLRAGFSYLRGSAALRLIFLLTLASGLLGRTAIELLPAVSGKMIGGDSGTLATLTAAAGVGSILGGLLVSRQSGRLRRLFDIVLLSLAVAAGILLSATLWRELWQLALAVGLVSLCTTTIGTGCQAITQLMVDEDYRGRVMSLWTVVAMGTPAIGAVLVGSLADYAGFPTAFAVTAMVAIGTIAWAWPRAGRYEVAW